MRRLLLVACLSAAVATGAVGLGAAAQRPGDSPPTDASGRPVCSRAPLVFADPITLGGGQGYEPSIAIDSAGTIFVTAHKQSLVAEGSRTASWLWRSTDLGKSFEDMTGDLLQVSDKRYALEGDLAVDGEDRLYFVDTWAADNHVYRFSEHGGVLDFVRLTVASAEVDDRPWLTAHGDGFVYYLSNTGMRHDGRLTLHRSVDGGRSFDTLGFTFPDSGWGLIDADPNGEHVYGVFNDLFYGTGLLGDALAVYGWHSPDRGEQWSVTKIADLVHAPYNGDGYPVVAVSPADGSVWALWLDGASAMMLANSSDRGASWTVRDITPFDGTYGFAWLDVGPSGEVAVTFSASATDLEQDETAERPYAMVVDVGSDCLTRVDDPGSRCAEPVGGRYVALQAETAGQQGDFFQVAIAPDGTINVPYTDRDHGTVIRYVRQQAGPNLSDRRLCGFSGSLLPGARVTAHERPAPQDDAGH